MDRAFDLGNARFRQGRRAEAIALWERSAALDPGNEDPWRNIGLTCAEDGDLTRAVEAFRKVLLLNPDAADVRHRLARALRRLGLGAAADKEEARARATERDPRALTRLARTRLRAGHVEACLAALRGALELAPSDVAARFQLAKLLGHVGRRREARSACRRVLAIRPSHAEARLLLRALDGPTPASLPTRMIGRQFDRFASDFDSHVQNRLRYRGPAVVWRAVQKVLAAREREAAGLTILDAGCGTGLAAPLLRPAARRLVGVDLSEGMLAKARERATYDRLVRGDIVRHLRTTRVRYDVVFAADVLVYVGDLRPVLDAAHRALRPGGLLAFSVEVCAGSGFRLNPTGRYSHSRAYVRALARTSGFVVREMRTATLRHELGRPVRSAIAVLQWA
jgi:predicted TPR repeat methyltransferase